MVVVLVALVVATLTIGGIVWVFPDTVPLNTFLVPLVVSSLPRLDRRWLMAGLTTLAIASNVLVAIAPVFGLMLAALTLARLAWARTD